MKQFLIFTLLSMGFSVSTHAQTTYQNCVQANENAGGGAAACAQQICKLQDCKTANQANPSTCATLEQSMYTCFRNQPQTKPKALSTPGQWCKTGRDSDIDLIRKKVNALKSSIAPKQKTRKAAYTAAAKLRADYQDLNARVQKESAAHDALKTDTPKAYKKYQKKWVKSGRLDALNADIAHLKQIKSQFDMALNHYKQADQDYRKTKTRYTTITQTTLDANHDCQGALNALQ